MTPASPAPPPAAPPASGPQEAATPVEALAAKFEEVADGYAGDGRAASDRGNVGGAAVFSARCSTLRACAGMVRALAPAWDALAAERDDYAARLKATDQSWAQVATERDAAREELATCRERNAAIAVQLDQYRDERDEACNELVMLREMIARAALAGEGA